MSNEKMRVLLICPLLTVIPGGGGESRTRMAAPAAFGAVPCHSEHPSGPPPLAEENPKLAILKSETKCKTGRITKNKLLGQQHFYTIFGTIKQQKWAMRDSNPRPTRCKRVAPAN